MRSIHYFPRYSQKENVVTNNTLLLLLRLLDYSKQRFEDFLGKLAGDADLDFSPAWLRIGQQLSGTSSVVDGFIGQDSVRIAVETKLHPQFLQDQLIKHLSIFRKVDEHKLLILLSPQPPFRQGLSDFLDAAREQGVEVLFTTFEAIISAMKDVLTVLDEKMFELLRDFEEFCDESELLPNDRYIVFSPPCGPSFADNDEFQLYYCSADRGGRRAQYLGVYANKAVRAIGRISKAVVCSIDIQAGEVKAVDGQPLTEAEKTRILGATQNAPKHGWDITKGYRFYLCDDWCHTNFRKCTHGGIQGHRMFDLRKILGAIIPQDASGIAIALDGKTWE